MEVKPSYGYPKANRWVPARATSIGANKSVLALKISFGSLYPFHRQVEFQSRPAAVGISRRPRFSMIERRIARPIPIPFDLVVKKASKSPWHGLGIDAFSGAEPRFWMRPVSGWLARISTSRDPSALSQTESNAFKTTRAI